MNISTSFSHHETAKTCEGSCHFNMMTNRGRFVTSYGHQGSSIDFWSMCASVRLCVDEGVRTVGHTLTRGLGLHKQKARGRSCVNMPGEGGECVATVFSLTCITLDSASCILQMCWWKKVEGTGQIVPVFVSKCAHICAISPRVFIVYRWWLRIALVGQVLRKRSD